MNAPAPQITVLMPTANRVEYVSRALAFLKRHFANQTIVHFRMLDGSTDENAGLNERACRLANVEYCRFPIDMLPYERIHAGLEQVETPLVVLLPDDDFFNPVGFFQAVEFMMAHPEYSAAHGDYISFRIGQNQSGLEWWHGYKRNLTYDQSDPMDRLFDYFGAYTPVHYAIHRTHLLRTGFSEVLTHVDPLEYKFSEFLIAAIVLAQGKLKKIDEFYMARQVENSTPYERTTMAQQMFDPRFSDRYLRFKRCLMRYLTQANLGDEQLSQAIDVVFGHYLGTWLRPHYLKNRLVSIRRRSTPEKTAGDAQTVSPSQAPLAQTRKKKNLHYYYKRVLQALRHPKRLIPKPHQLYRRKYAPVLDFLYAYLNDPKNIGLNLEIGDSAAKR